MSLELVDCLWRMIGREEMVVGEFEKGGFVGIWLTEVLVVER